MEAFLAGRIGFLDIAATVATCLDHAERESLVMTPLSLADVLAVDELGRTLARNVIGAGRVPSGKQGLAQA